jgi:hypothetical protein
MRAEHGAFGLQRYQGSDWLGRCFAIASVRTLPERPRLRQQLQLVPMRFGMGHSIQINVPGSVLNEIETPVSRPDCWKFDAQ